MGFITYCIKVKKISKDKTATADFSPCEIISAIVNLWDAKKYLSQEEYFFVTAVFETYERRKSKLHLNQKMFLDLCNEIIAHLDLIAPYYKFSGNPNMKLEMIIEEYKTEYRQRAKILLKNKKLFEDEWMILHKEFMQEFYC